MATSKTKDRIRQAAQAAYQTVREQAAKKTQSKPVQNTGTKNAKSTDTKSNPSKPTQSKQKAGGNSGRASVKNTAKKGATQALQTAAQTQKGQQAARVEKAMQAVLDRDRFSRDVLTRQQVRSDNLERRHPSVLPDAPFVRERFNPKALESDRDWKQLMDDYDINERLAGRRAERATHQDVIRTTTLDPLSALKADSRSHANFGRGAGMKPKELTPEERAQKEERARAEQARKDRAAGQALSRYDQRLPDQIQEAIRLARADYAEAAERGDRKAMREAHRRAETWRRIKGGYSGGRSGDEYISPEISAEDRANLTEEGLRRLASAKIGWQNSWNDTDRARYAQMGEAIRRNPAYQRTEESPAFDRGAYREEDAHGRMRYAGTPEEREREREQAAAIPKAIATGIAGSLASIPGTTLRALQATASKDNALLQAVSDARGGGEVNIPAPGEINPDSLGQRLLRKSDEYREKATEGQRGFERYLTEALITGGEMIPGLAATALSGGAAAPGLAVMGAQAAGRKMGTLEAQGISPDEAFERGVLAGAIEAGTERIPLRNLAKIAKGGGSSFARNLATQALEEVGTEEISEIGNYLADKAFRDPNASLTAQDLKDTAVISLLTSLGMGAGAGMIGSARSGQTGQQAQRETAAMDTVTPGIDTLAAQEAELEAAEAKWKMAARRNLDRLAQSANDPTFHKHLLNELRQHEAQGEQLRQQRIGLEMQKAQRTQVEQQKAEQAAQQQQETNAQASALSAALDALLTDTRPLPSQQTERASMPPPLNASNAPQEAAESPQTAAAPEQGQTIPEQREAPAQAQEMGAGVAREARAEWEAQQNQQTQAEQEAEPTQRFETAAEEAAYLRGKLEALIARRSSAVTPEQQDQWDREKDEIDREIQDAYDRWHTAPAQEAARAKDAAQEAEGQPDDAQEARYSVGAAPGGFDPLSDWQLGTDQFHPINNRAVEAEAETWGRAPVDIPIRDPYGQMTSKTASTLINAGMTPDQISRGLTEMARNGQLSRIPYTDSAATAEAERVITEKGYQRAKESWLSDIHAGKMSKDLTTMGIVLYNNAANSGHIVEAMDLATEMIEYGKSAGQVLQAVNIINKLGPTGKLYSLATSLEKLETKIRQNKKLDAEHWDGITIPEDLGKAYVEAQTEEEQLAIETEIKKAVAQQIPNTLGDKLDAWRYMAMLGNPRTQLRNVVGNLGFQPLRIAKNMIGAGLERMMGLDPSERTKSLQFKGLSKADKARYDAGLAEYDSVESIIMGNGKYNDTFSDIDQYRTIFRFKPFEGWRQLTNAGLEKGDVFFARRTYADSLAGVLKARGITAEQYTDPAFSPQTREAIQAIAIEEAQKATYRDLNQFSQFIMKKLGGTPQTTLEKWVHYLTEGLLPFKKTPANILVRGVEYSPVGLIKGIADMGTKVRNGEMTAAQGIDELASGLTGTALLGLGAALGLAGIVTPGDDEDDAQNKFNQLLGKQSYALNLPGGYSITLDWMAPEAIPFFMGVELQNGIQEIKAGEKGKDVIWNALRRISDPMLEMSMLQGVNDLLDNLSYADNKAMSVISTLATGYLTQFVPTIGGQIERSFEDRRYSTWIDRDSWVPNEIQYLLGKTFNKLPGEYHQREYLNAWGEPEMTGAPALRIFSNFISPGYIKKAGGGEVEDELQRLYNEGFNVFPTIEKTSTKINGEQVTAEQFNLLQGTKGQLMKDLYTQAINSDEYKELADADKADYLSKLKKYATVKGEQAAGENPDKVPEWIVKLDSAATENNIEVSALLRASLTMDTKYDADGNGSIKTEEAWGGIQDMAKNNGLSDGMQKALFNIYNGTNKTYDEYKAEADKKAEVQANIDKYISTLPKEMQTSLMDSCGGNLAGFTQAEAYDAILNLGGTYEQQKAAFDGIQAAKGENAWEEKGSPRSFDSFMAKQKKEAAKAEKTKSVWGDAPQEHVDAFRTAFTANEQSYHGFFKSCEEAGLPRKEWPSAFKDANNARGSKAFNKSFEQAYYHVYGKEWAI